MHTEDVSRSLQRVPANIESEPSAAVVFGADTHRYKNVVLINTGKGVI